MKILITGSTGMLASECRMVFSQGHEVIAPSKNMLDIVSWDGVVESLQKFSPDVVLNCAGFTDVDAAEADPYTVHKLNVEGPRNLAQGSARYECTLLQISSDYVFDGKKMAPQPYFEDDVLYPLSTYGMSKMESEIAVRENSSAYIILRTSWLYGVHGANFVKFIVGHALKGQTATIKVVTDQMISPTWAYRLALQIKGLLEHEARGTYHATSEGYCTPFEYAEFILAKLGLKAFLQPCTLDELKRPAKRPRNCILENRLLKKQGLNMMKHWKEDLDAFLDEFGETIIKGAESKKS